MRCTITDLQKIYSKHLHSIVTNSILSLKYSFEDKKTNKFCTNIKIVTFRGYASNTLLPRSLNLNVQILLALYDFPLNPKYVVAHHCRYNLEPSVELMTIQLRLLGCLGSIVPRQVLA